ncbi:MAG: hypothetical protein GY768_03035 [Planctomycetaceae bacterium]|nr:hypothetical protein [Planctomycetaceae bacterium]
MKIKRRFRRDDSDSGLDSFLDIVANLVGILVILVMVIGVRAQDALVDDPANTISKPTTDEIKKANQLQTATQDLTSNVREIEQQANQIKELVDRRHSERHQLKVLLTAAKRELDTRSSKLDSESQSRIKLQSEALKLATALDEVRQQRDSLENEQEKTIELEHLPTPLAKTVFGGEEHFQLKDGYLTHVPLNVLTDQLKAEVPNKIWKLKQVPEITETIGPMQGFHLRYTMYRKNYASISKAGPVVRQVAELKEFVLVPMSSRLGEPADEALLPDSQFAQLIESFNSSRTVITVWTYPDSFGKFRELKRWLYERGFACAARPLPADQPISGSPRGSRSAAQ